MTEQVSIGKEAAIALAATRWWKGKSAREIAERQLFTKELCCPFDVFHEAVEQCLGRGVWTHEFGLNYDGIVAEFLGTKPPPTMGQIIDMLPANVPVVLVAKE